MGVTVVVVLVVVVVVLQVVRSSASNNNMSGSKELHYLLRLLAPAACRHPQLFMEITQQCLRIDLNMTLKRNLMSTNSECDLELCWWLLSFIITI